LVKTQTLTSVKNRRYKKMNINFRPRFYHLNLDSEYFTFPKTQPALKRSLVSYWVSLYQVNYQVNLLFDMNNMETCGKDIHYKETGVNIE
jgi:hypothetical protein